jgi:hypothetical protein
MLTVDHFPVAMEAQLVVLANKLDRAKPAAARWVGMGQSSHAVGRL